MTTSVDVLIAGQGLAGSMLAMACHRHGLRVHVVDDPALPSASRVAAGLVTPITGQRAVLSWRLATLLPFARAAYRELAHCLADDLGEPKPIERWHEQPAWRVLSDEEQAHDWQRRCQRDPELATYCGELQPLPCAWPIFGHAVLPLLGQARVDLVPLVDDVRRWLAKRNALTVARISPHDVVFDSAPSMRWQAIRARWLVICQGAASAQWPEWQALHFRPARGDLLTIACDFGLPLAVFHADVFLAPLAEGLWRVGATYDWQRDYPVPCPAGRAKLEASVQKLLRTNYRVVDHQAGVRPVIGNRVPVIGVHPQVPALAIFSGLASKGALWAPYFAEQLAAHLANQRALEPEVDVGLRFVARSGVDHRPR